MDKVKATGGTAKQRLQRLTDKAVGGRITRAVRDEMRSLAEPLRESGEVCDVVGAAALKRSHDGLRPVWDMDVELLDAALAAGVPVADPQPEVGFRLTSWLNGARRGSLAALGADPRFRPLLRDAVLGRPGELLALGRPACALRDDAGVVASVLGASGLVEVLHDAVVGWAAAVAAGSLPALHEATYYLDLLGPARLAEICPAAGEAIGELLRADIADLLAATWRTGLVDELGDVALDAYDDFWPSDDVYRMEPEGGADEDTFAVTRGTRTTLFGPKGAVTGPASSPFPNDVGSAVTPHRIRYAQGRFTKGRITADDTVRIAMPAAERPSTMRRGGDGWWELCDERGTVNCRWYQGPSRPARVSGGHSVGRRRHRWVAGSELVPPAQVWGRLVARDEAGSRVLRGADRALAARVLDAMGADLAARITELGRRLPVANHSWEVDEAFEDVRRILALHLPDVTSDRLLDGIVGSIWSAAECRVLMTRHLDDDATTLRATPLPYPRDDPGDLRARIFTGMQDMFLELGRVADACADPKVVDPPRTARLADALGWETQLGRLGGRALRAAVHGKGPDRSNDLRADAIRACGVPHISNPAGRWRTLRMDVSAAEAGPQGTVWRTARGCLIMLQSSRSGGLSVLEYAADGTFDAPPFGTVISQRVCTGWGGMDRIAALLRLLAEQGPAPWPVRSIEAFAEAIGTSVPHATLLAIGFEPRDVVAVNRGSTGLPPALILASGLPESALSEAAADLAKTTDAEDRLRVPEFLMPDDPADVWRDHLSVTRAAQWWNTRQPA